MTRNMDVYRDHEFVDFLIEHPPPVDFIDSTKRSEDWQAFRDQVSHNPAVPTFLKKEQGFYPPRKYTKEEFTEPVDGASMSRHRVQILLEASSIRPLSTTCWRSIWMYGDVTEEMVHDFHQREFDWELSRNLFLPPDFWARNSERAVPYELTQNPALPYPFLRKHPELMNPDLLGGNPTTPISYIMEHFDTLNPECIALHPFVPVELLRACVYDRRTDQNLFCRNLWMNQRHFHPLGSLDPDAPFLREIKYMPPKTYPRPVFRSMCGVEYQRSKDHFESIWSTHRFHFIA